MNILLAEATTWPDVAEMAIFAVATVLITWLIIRR